MSKKKKKKPTKRPYLLPKDWLIALADKLHMQNPSKAIIFNTIKDIYCKAFSGGYFRSREDDKYFKNKREQDFDRDWKTFKDELDDKIHEKSNA